MRKPDEIAFYAALRARTGHPGPDAIADEALRLGIPPKRALRILEKWNGAGWWEFGVLLGEGWFTKSAPEELSA